MYILHPITFVQSMLVHELLITDLRKNISDFSWNVGVGLFDLLTLTVQGQIFFGGPSPPRNCQKKFDLERSL